MSIRGKAAIVGAYEHPARALPDKSIAQIHADVAFGALADAGLSLSDVDGLFSDGNVGVGSLSLPDYLGIRPSYLDTTNTGGSSYLCHAGHAATAIAAGKCHVALVTLAGKGRDDARPWRHLTAPTLGFEAPFGTTIIGEYAMAARRHMYEYGTTSDQLAEIKVAASHHAQYNKHALLPEKVSVEDVLASPMVSDPLHRLDCCVITDGGGALVIVSEEIARTLGRSSAKILGHGEAYKSSTSQIDLTYTAAVWSGPRAFEEAGVTPSDVDYASVYDSFTITVLMTLEDLGFCAKGKGGDFVRDGALQAPFGRLPFNTDGGGLCSNHPANKGGMTKIIEAVRQIRGEASPQVQVPDCEIAIAHGTGGSIGTRMVSSTLVLGRADA